MRVAIVSDVHGNMAALEAVLADLKSAGPDLVVQGGDLVMGGHRAAEVVDCFRELGWPGVVGNTDEVLWGDESRAALERSAPQLGPLLRMIFDDVDATLDLLGPERVAWLRALPMEWRSSDAQIAVVHASPGNLWRAPGPEASDADLLATYGSLGDPIAVYGHIHRPYVRALPGITVANTGSAGSPYDGDPRASYLLIEDGRCSIRRVAYDVERGCRELVASGYPHAAWLAEIRRRGAYVPPAP
jgi:putative phosphoesterase